MTKSNVHPDHYKEAGRERQGEDIVQEKHRERLATERAQRRDEMKDGKEGKSGPKPPGR